MRHKPDDIPDASLANRHQFRFDNFSTYTGNSAACSAISNLAPAVSGADSPLRIEGPEGSGKSHLLLAFAHEIVCRHPDAALSYQPAELLARQARKAIAADTLKQTIRGYQALDFFLVDDIQFLARHRETQMFLVEVAEHFTEVPGKTLLMAGTMPSSVRKTLEPTVVSLLNAGRLLEIGLPGFSDRTAILMERSREHGLNLSRKIAEQVATRCHGNIRELMNALTRLRAEGTLSGRVLTPDMVRRALEAL